MSLEERLLESDHRKDLAYKACDRLLTPIIAVAILSIAHFAFGAESLTAIVVAIVLALPVSVPLSRAVYGWISRRWMNERLGAYLDALKPDMERLKQARSDALRRIAERKSCRK